MSDAPKPGLERLRRKVYDVVEKAADPEETLSYAFDVFIMVLIILNVVCVVIETVESIHSEYEAWFWAFELFSVVVFSAEFLLRLWSCTVHADYEHPLWGRLRFLAHPYAIVDLLAIAPFYIEVLDFGATRQFRLLRLFRFLRVLKLGRYSQSIDTFIRVLKSKKEEIVIAMLVVFVLLVFSASVIYSFENAQQPEAFSSIPASMWWAVATLTTVGYGDVYPVTTAGKFFAAIVAILGIGVFALPAGIIASGFADEIERRRSEEAAEAAAEAVAEAVLAAGPSPCPHCGEDIHAPPAQGEGA